MTHSPAVGVPPGGVPQPQEPVVQEGDGQTCLAWQRIMSKAAVCRSVATCEDHKDAEGQEEDLLKGDHPQYVPGLQLHQADHHPGSPPGIMT